MYYTTDLKGGVIGGVTSMGDAFLPGMVSMGGGSGGLFSTSLDGWAGANFW